MCAPLKQVWSFPHPRVCVCVFVLVFAHHSSSAEIARSLGPLWLRCFHAPGMTSFILLLSSCRLEHAQQAQIQTCISWFDTCVQLCGMLGALAQLEMCPWREVVQPAINQLAAACKLKPHTSISEAASWTLLLYTVHASSIVCWLKHVFFLSAFL